MNNRNQRTTPNISSLREAHLISLLDELSPFLISFEECSFDGCYDLFFSGAALELIIQYEMQMILAEF